MNQKTIDILDTTDYVANMLKRTFVAKDELIELLMTSALAQEHLLIVGPPGTAKSELIKRFALLCSGDGQASKKGSLSYFEYLLTRFTEPNELFGPINISAFQKGRGTRRDTRNMLPRAEIAFLDEVFKANSAILNALLTLLNERIFYNGDQRDEVPLLCAIGATNAVPDDPELAALYDRFLLRVWTDNVEEPLFPQLFHRGWKLECNRIAAGYGLQLSSVTSTDALRELYKELEQIDVAPIEKEYREVVRRIRAEGIQLSDRRVIKLLKLIAASALRQRRPAAGIADFWVLRHVWNDPGQIPHLQTIVDAYVDAAPAAAGSGPERPLDEISHDLGLLIGRAGKLRTDTDYADYLQQIERLRHELIRHSAAQDAEQSQQQRDMLAEIENSIDHVLAVVEETL